MAKIKYHSAEALKQLKLLVDEFVSLKNNISDIGVSTENSFSKIEKKLFSLQMLSGKTKKAIDNLADSIDKNTLEQSKNSKAIERQLKLGNTYNKQIAENTRKNIANTKSLKKKSTALKDLFKFTGLLGALNYLKQLGGVVFEMAKDFDSLQYSMQVVSDTSFDLASSQRFLLRITEDYGVELLATSQRYIKFLAAAKQSNLSLNDTEKIFGSVTKAASVLGLKTNELNGVYLALEQMLSKGKVTTEELRRQLGERLPGAMGIMAAALDVTIPKLDEMLKKGEVMSAEALPKFADAVELAYGIQSVKKIDTLISAKNRLINTWQTFIQDVTRSEGFLNNFFKGFINNLNETIKILSSITGSRELKLQNSIIKDTKGIEVALDYQVDVILKKSGIFVKNYDKLILESRARLLKYKPGSSAYKKEEDNLRKIVKLSIKQNEEVKLARKKAAAENFKSTRDEFVKIEEEYNKGLNNLKSLKEKKGKLTSTGLASEALIRGNLSEYKKLTKEIVSQEKALDEMTPVYSRLSAAFDVYIKLLQESNVQTLPGKINSSGKKQLNEIKDLQNKIDIEKLQSSIQLNKMLLNSDEVLIEDKKQLLLDISKYEIKIARITADDKNDINRIKYDKEIKSLEKYLKEGKITQKEFDKQSVDLLNQKNQKLELNELEYNKKMKSSKLSLGKDLLKIVEEQEKTKINIIEDKYNKQIIILNDTYNTSKKTAKDWEDLERGKKKVAVDMANEIIDAQIAILEVQKAIPNQSKESIDEIIRLINKLNASKKNLNPKGKGIISWQEWAQKIGEVISEVGNFVDALYDRKIEAIDAEIAAEEKKYDKLISLAENDASKKAALEQQKADKIAILEKKRLKEEQKQAKVRKAFAISEIAINTAIAYTKALAQGGFILGIPMANLMLALGALQTAVVLAQPIPQYKDGLDRASKDHVAMINDGGKKEYVERKGKILSTNTKNAIVNLKQGDTVHKDYEHLTKNSKAGLILSRGEILKQNEFDKLTDVLETGISKGFKNIKVKNTNIIKTNNSNNYLRQKSRFNG